MKKLTAAKRRFLENATLIAASRLIFSRLQESGASLYYLSDLAETTSGGTPDRRVSNYYGGRISWLKSGELNNGFIDSTEEFITEEGLRNSSAKIYPKGTLVVALYGATVGKTGILTIDAASNQAVCAVIPRTKEVTTRYLHWFFRYKRPEFLNSSFGGAQPNISQRVIRETKLPLPSIELQEQICGFLDAVERRKNSLDGIDLPDLPSQLSGIHHTVARIEELAARIEEARELRMQAEKETEALILRISGKIFKKLSLIWGTQSFEEIATKITDGEHITPRRSEFGHYLLSARNIQNNCINLENVDFVDDDEFCRIRKRCDPSTGDVLISCSGSIGKIALVDESESYVMVRSVAMVRPNQRKIEPDYLAHAMRSQLLQDQMRDKSRSTAQANLFLGKIRSLMVPVPPILEQRRVVAHLDALQLKLDALKRHQAETTAELDALLPAVLERAFRGEI